MLRLLAFGSLLICVLATSASAQVLPSQAPGSATSLTIAAFDPDQAVAPISIVEGPGWKVGEGTVIHPVFGLETGYVSNVFFQDTNEKPAGVLRLLGQLGIASLSTSRLNPNTEPYLAAQEEDDASEAGADAGDRGALQYQASVRLAYDQPLSGDQVVRDTGGLGVGGLLRLMANPMGKVSFGLDDNFVRLIRAANFETAGNVNRDVNQARLTLLFHPAGRSVSGYLYYQNTIDVFEQSFNQYPDRIDNRLGLHPMWQWLPETQVYGDVSMGVITGLGSDAPSAMKVTSYPLLARAGIATLLSLKTTANLSAGYTNGFYSSGPSFSAPMVSAMVAYRYSPLGRIGVGYDLMYVDSVNANYFRDHLVRMFVQQAIDPLVFMIQPELHFREYNGVTVPGPSTTRDDVIFSVVGGVHYSFRNWVAATLDYRFSTVQTDYRYTVGAEMVNPSYARHELLLGLRAAM